MAAIPSCFIPAMVCSKPISWQGALPSLIPSRRGSMVISLALLVTVLARRRQIALGIGLGVWIFYELIYGVIMLASTLYLPAKVLKTTLLVGLLGNPVDLARVLSLLQVGGPHLFGPAGATLVKLTGSVAVATGVGLVGLLLWVVVPFLVAAWIFKRQNL